MQIEDWASVNHHPGLAYDELIEMVRLEAMTRAMAGTIIGAALMICATGPDGEDAVLTQVHTAHSSESHVHRVTADGLSLEDPLEISPILPDGLCFFPHV